VISRRFYSTVIFLSVVAASAAIFFLAQAADRESGFALAPHRAFPASSEPLSQASQVPQVLTDIGEQAATGEMAQSLPVLTYHSIRTVIDPGDSLGYGLSVSAEEFEKQMKFLNHQGYTTLTPDDLLAVLQKKEALPQKSIMLTFDDGYEDFYTAAFPILKKYKFKATVFIVTGFLGDGQNRYMTWEEIRELDQSGIISIASHTQSHSDLTKSKDAKKEIEDSKSELENFLGHPIITFVYPYGLHDSAAVLLVSRAGYALGFTTQEGTTMSRARQFALPRVRIWGGMPWYVFVEKVEMLTP